jgi:hypothetical protein
MHIFKIGNVLAIAKKTGEIPVFFCVHRRYVIKNFLKLYFFGLAAEISDHIKMKQKIFPTKGRRKSIMPIQKIIEHIEKNERTSLYLAAKKILFEQNFKSRIFDGDQESVVVELEELNLVASEVLYDFCNFTVGTEDGYPVVSGVLELTDISVIAKTRCATEAAKRTYTACSIQEEDMMFSAGYIFWNAGNLRVQFSAIVEASDRIEVKFSTAINEGVKTDGIR